MAIKLGDRLPSVRLMHMTAEGPRPILTEDIFAGRKVALFAVPGAFTPTCSANHLPGFLQHADALKAKGIDCIACVAVNDVFVMDAWGKDRGVGERILMLADGSGDFTRALGLELDLRDKGLGVRSQRYSMLVEDGLVTQLNIEKPGAFEVSKAEHLLEQV